MDNLVVYILVTLLSGAIGAGIGTYLGSHFSAQKQERRNKEIRNIAIKALNIIKKYSGKGNTYDMAEADFNTSLSVAEKRIFMVSLHKLGIPILATSETKFDIQHICFEKIVIDKDEILAIIKQVESGYCDKLFYIDPDTYFTDNIRLSTLRSVSKRWVKEIFAKSKLDLNTRMINYPNKWFESFTWAGNSEQPFSEKGLLLKIITLMKETSKKERQKKSVQTLTVVYGIAVSFGI